MPEHQHPFRGIHILGELYGVEPALLHNREFLTEQLSKGIKMSGATLCGIHSKQFNTGGITILALLSESHASIHTYPEFGSLFFDAFTCGDQCLPQNIANFLVEVLRPQHQKFQEILRGTDSDRSISHWTRA